MMKVMAVLLGLSFPLINIRLPLPVWSPSIFMIAIVAFILIFITKYKYKFKAYYIEIFIAGFFFMVTVSTVYSLDLGFGIERLVKLVVILSIYFFLSRALFISNFDFQIFVKASLISSSVFLLYLGYIYLVVFNVNYIGVNTDYPTGENKNALAFLLVVAIPFYYGLLESKRYLFNSKFISILLLLIVLTGGLLTLSRSFIVILAIYICILALISKKRLNFLFLFFGSFSLMIFLGSEYLSESLIMKAGDRLESLFFIFGNSIYHDGGDSIISGTSSINKREFLIEKAFSIFYEHPLLGAGNGSFMIFPPETLISHNDYALVLAEQGIIGFVFYVLMVIGFIFVANKNWKISREWLDKSIFIAVIGLTINMLSNNIYDSIYLWFIYAIVTARYFKINKKREVRLNA
jgi:O-antigen ligase